jgi:hypothetical protein
MRWGTKSVLFGGGGEEEGGWSVNLALLLYLSIFRCCWLVDHLWVFHGIRAAGQSLST